MEHSVRENWLNPKGSNMLYAVPDRELPAVAIAALLVQGQDASCVAAAFDLSCASVRAIAKQYLCELMNRRSDPLAVETVGSELTQGMTFAAVLATAVHVCRVDIVNVLALLTPRERQELLEASAYYRAFRNSPVKSKEVHYGQI